MSARLAFALVLAWIVPSLALAQAPDVGVVAESCDGLDVARVEALIEIELSASRLGDRAIRVHLRCDAADVQIRVSEPISDHHVERRLPRPLADAPERAVAIAIAQLLSASWSELMIALEQLRSNAEPFAAESSTDASEPEPDPAREPDPAPEPRDPLRLDLRLGARAHDLATPFATFRGALGLAIPTIDRVRVLAVLGAEVGVAERQRGGVLMHAYQLALGVEVELARAGIVALTADVLAAAGYVVLEGTPGSAAAFGASSSGFAGDVAIALCGWLELDPLHLGLRASIGGGLGIEGLVIDEPSVRYGRGFAVLTLLVATPL